MVDSSTPIERLIRLCAESGDAGAWQEFVRQTQRLIAGVALRTARRWGERSPSVLEDIIQETYLKLCSNRARLLREFESRRPDAFYSYLKVVAANVAHDYFRAKASEKRGGGGSEEPLDQFQGELSDEHPGGLSSVDRDVLLSEIDDLLRRHLRDTTQERDRMIFWLYYRQGMTARAIAALPSVGLSTEGVESVIMRLTRLVRSELAEARLGGAATRG